MKNLIVSMSLVLLGLSAGAQIDFANDIEIFSDKGELFTLYVNGQQVNQQPSSYVKVENIRHNIIQARIEIEDENKSEVKKEILVLNVPGVDSTSDPVVAIFKLKKRLKIFNKRKYRLKSTERYLKQPPLNYVMI